MVYLAEDPPGGWRSLDLHPHPPPALVTRAFRQILHPHLIGLGRKTGHE